MESTNPNSLFTDYTKLITHFKLPGVDVGSLMESQRKDIEALATANSAAIAGVQAIGQKQVDILRDTFVNLQSMMAQMGTTGSEPRAKAGEIVQKALHKALTDMQDLADTAYRAQTESTAVVTKRVAEHIEEIKALLQPAAK